MMVYHFRLRRRLTEWHRDLPEFSRALQHAEPPASLRSLCDELYELSDCATTNKVRADEFLAWLRTLPGCHRGTLKVWVTR